MKRLLWFGFYDPKFTRTRVLLTEVRGAGNHIDECRVDPRQAGKKKYTELWKKGREARKERYDAVIVAFPGFNAVWMAKLLFRAPIIYDAGYSVYQAEVEDRQSCPPRSLRAFLLWLMDASAVWLSDKVILDTRIHIAYFSKLFRINASKFFTLPVGADTALFRPMEFRTHEPFTTLFYGTFIPLHGVETILDAAERLRDQSGIVFRLVGNGQTAPMMRQIAEARGLTNVHFTGTLPQSSAAGRDVLAEMRGADVVLGIFGAGRKTSLQVPLKVFEAMACGKPIITADTPALRELMIPGAHVLTVPPADGAALAAVILRLKEDGALRNTLSENGLKKFQADFAPEKIRDLFLSHV